MEIQELIKKYGISPNTSLGQHFINVKAAKAIVKAADINSNETILDIGAGTGVLTKEIAKHAGKVIAVEIDPNLAGILKKETKGFGNVVVIHKNILDCIQDLNFDKIVSNIPYLIAEPLMQRLVFCSFSLAVITLPAGFYEILAAGETSKKYSRLSLIFQSFFSLKKLLSMPPDAFYPKGPENITAEIKRLSAEDYKKRPEKYIIRELHLQKTKKVKNALMEAVINLRRLNGLRGTKREARETIRKFNLGRNLLEKRAGETDLNDLKTILYETKDYLRKL